MNIKEVMSKEPRTVRMVDRLDTAARVLWDQDCGIVPVVDGNQAIVGVVTDRDLCMASYTQGKALAEIPVTAAMGRVVRTCKPDDPIAAALATMQQHQIHRLPVVDARGVVVGVVAMNDLIRLSQARPAVVDGAAVLKTLAAIGASRRAQKPAVAAPAVAAAPPTPAKVAVAAPAQAAASPAVVAAPVAASSKSKSGKAKGKKG
jgi:CBS domain-containing protein